MNGLVKNYRSKLLSLVENWWIVYIGRLLHDCSASISSCSKTLLFSLIRLIRLAGNQMFHLENIRHVKKKKKKIKIHTVPNIMKYRK